MSQFKIDNNLEFFEVLNEFPCLKNTLEDLHIDFNDIIEGESIINFFNRNDISKEEGRVILRKINLDIHHFLKNGELPKKREIQTFSLEEE